MLQRVAVMALCLVPVSARAEAVTLPKVTVVASGLDNPRGLALGPGGPLYVAERGTGGTASTQARCAQVPRPVGPYTGGFTASISRISRREPGQWWPPGWRPAKPALHRGALWRPGQRELVASGVPSRRPGHSERQGREQLHPR